MNRIRRARGLAAALVIGAVAGCTAGSDPAQEEPEIGTVPVIRSAEGLRLPLDAYSMTQRDYLSVQRASWRLTRDCVERFGGDYTLPESTVVRNAPPDVRNQRRYGLFDAASAADHGYRIAEEATAAQERRRPRDGAKGGGWSPSAAELVLVRGAQKGKQAPRDAAGRPLPADGCSGDATRRVEGGPRPPDDQLGNRLAVETHRRAENDSRVPAAVSRWSDCMRQRGYSYRGIWEPDDHRWPVPTGDEEIATATDDVECKQNTNLAGVWYAVELALQNRAIEEHAEDLETVRTYLRATVRNSAHVIAGG